MHGSVTLTSLTPVCLATRTQALWIQAQDDRGLIGVGESCPIEAVTVETVTTALAFVARHQREWIDEVSCVASLMGWAERHRADIDANPSTWTAVELVCLDLLAQNQGCSVERLLGVPELAGRFCYTASLHNEPPARFAVHLDQLLAMGFENLKITLSGRLQDDRARIRLLQDAGVPEACVRATANYLWSDSCSCVRYIDSLGLRFMALEEPLLVANLATMNRVARALNTTIILDTGFIRREQLQEVCSSPDHEIRMLDVLLEEGGRVAPPRFDHLHRRSGRTVTRAGDVVSRTITADHPPTDEAGRCFTLYRPHREARVGVPRGHVVQAAVFDAVSHEILDRLLAAFCKPSELSAAIAGFADVTEHTRILRPAVAARIASANPHTCSQ